MKNKISLDEKEAALHTAHNLILADQVINIGVSGFSSTVTLGFINPASIVQPSITFTMPTDVLHSFANEILDAIKAKSAEIKAQHQEFDNLI
ncbi:MAG: hypothetical protein PHC99_12575 [Methylococcales bacterium]|nr:hypothetical protein [Methylococcales bacterium]